MGFSGLALGLAIAIAGFLILARAWRQREQEPDTKTAETVAACGLAAAVLVFIVSSLAHALIVLLLGAQLALNALLKEHRQLKFGWMTSFVTLMLGAVHATNNSYLLVFCLFALFLLLGTGHAWLDRHNHAGEKAWWPALAQGRIACAWLFVAFVFYLLTPRLDALLWGVGGTMSGSGYYDRDWERQAQNIGNRDPRDTRGSRDGRRQQSGSEGGHGTRSSGASGSSGYQGFNQRRFDITRPDPGDGRVSNIKVLSMQAPHGAYLRVRSFDRFDGVTWHTTLTSHQIWRGDFGRFSFDNGPRLAPNFNQQMQVLAPLTPAIPGTAPAIVLHFPAAALRRTEYGTFEAPRGLQPDTRYTVESRITRHDGRFFDRISPPPRPQDTALPDDFDPRIAQLASDVTTGSANAREQAITLEAHLRTQYQYSLSTAFTSQNRTPLSEFLFETKNGHCEFFAAALAVMLRSQDIPTRLATGYSATTYNPITGRYEIRVLDGHAWVEAWIDDAWMLLEPTPFYPLPQSQEGQLTAEQIKTYLERLEEIDDALGETNMREIDPQRLLLMFWQAVIEAANLIIAAFAWVLLALWPLWLLLAGLALAGYAIWRWQRDALLDWQADRRIRRYRFVHGIADFHFVFGEVQNRMSRRDRARSPGQNLADYCADLLEAGHLSHHHQALHTATHECFIEAKSWQPDWHELLLDFYADIKRGVTPRDGLPRRGNS
jgi:transglutaminase-like putative cysteine protease